MRIAIITGSRSSHVRVYVEYLRSAGHDVTVFTNGTRYLDTDIPTRDLRPLWGRRFRLPRALHVHMRDRRLCRALANGRFDVVNCQMVTPDALTAVGCSPAPVVLSFHGSDLYRRAHAPDDFAARLPAALSRATAVHAVSQHMAEELIALGAPAERVKTFQYGIYLSAYKPSPERDADRIVSVRALHPLYRVHLLIEAMPAVLAVRPAATLDVFDVGPEEPRLRALAQEMAVSSSVHFEGRRSISEIACAVGRAAVWASMAESDGTPLSLLEAMASGAYPVLADIPTLHEWVEPPRGSFVRPEAQAVSAGLIEGLARAATGAHIAENRRIVADRANRARNLARFERLLVDAAAMSATHDSRA